MKQDSSWRKILDKLLPEFLAFYFPEIHAAIDFERGVEFLDKELQKILPEQDDSGQRVVDKLVKVYLRDGSEKWLLIHIEVQGYRDLHFPKRVYYCNYRIADRFGEEVISVALLTDDDPNFRQNVYEIARWGFELYFKFPLVKLLDYREKWEDLVRDSNPFALATCAFLKTVETQGHDHERYQWKKRFLLEFYHANMSRATALSLLEFISVVMALPEAKDEELYEEIAPTTEEQNMSLLAIAERKGLEKGLEQGLVQGLVRGREQGIEQGIEQGLKETIADILEIKFGVGALAFIPQVEQIDSLEALRKIRAGLKQARSLAEAESVIRTFAPAPV